MGDKDGEDKAGLPYVEMEDLESGMLSSERR